MAVIDGAIIPNGAKGGRYAAAQADTMAQRDAGSDISNIGQQVDRSFRFGEAFRWRRHNGVVDQRGANQEGNEAPEAAENTEAPAPAPVPAEVQPQTADPQRVSELITGRRGAVESSIV